MSVVWLKSTPGLRSTSARNGTAARSSARMSLKVPLIARPIGVRTASTMTASGMDPPAREGLRARHVGHADRYGDGHARLLTLAFGADRSEVHTPRRPRVGAGKFAARRGLRRSEHLSYTHRASSAGGL